MDGSAGPFPTVSPTPPSVPIESTTVVVVVVVVRVEEAYSCCSRTSVEEIP